ncbi:conserved Plasmodium protein, unknown function, partial [Plasmodium malariae]
MSSLRTQRRSCLVELFLRNRCNVLMCQRALKQWKKNSRLKKNQREMVKNKYLLRKCKYFELWKKRLQKVSKRNVQACTLYKYRQLKNLNSLRIIYNEWKTIYAERKNVKKFVYVINSYVSKKLKYISFFIIYKNNEYYLKMQHALTHFLLEQRNKLKRKVLLILKYNKRNRIKNKTAVLFYFNNIKMKIFDALRAYVDKRVTYRRNEYILILIRKKKFFYAILNMYNFINKVKMSFYEIRENLHRKVKRCFLTSWLSLTLMRKRARETSRMILRKRENKMKAQLFYNIKRKVNRRNYTVLLLGRINQLIKIKMYNRAISILRENRVYVKIQEVRKMKNRSV